MRCSPQVLPNSKRIQNLNCQLLSAYRLQASALVFAESNKRLLLFFVRILQYSFSRPILPPFNLLFIVLWSLISGNFPLFTAVYPLQLLFKQYCTAALSCCSLSCFCFCSKDAFVFDVGVILSLKFGILLVFVFCKYSLYMYF